MYSACMRIDIPDAPNGFGHLSYVVHNETGQLIDHDFRNRPSSQSYYWSAAGHRLHGNQRRGFLHDTRHQQCPGVAEQAHFRFERWRFEETDGRIMSPEVWTHLGVVEQLVISEWIHLTGEH